LLYSRNLASWLQDPQTKGMRFPQSIIQSPSLRILNLLTISMGILLLVMAPARASAATPQLTCSPWILRFGDVVVGQTETMMVTVTNNGQTTVNLSGFAVSNSAFTPSSLSLPLVLAAGQSFDLSVTFTPTATGWTGGRINFSSNASNATLGLGIEGTGASSVSLTASPSMVSFGQVPTGTSSTVPVVLTSSQHVTIATFQTMGSGFSFSGPTLPLILSPGQSVTVNVTFSPLSATTQGGNVFAFGPGVAIPLTGIGTTAAQQYSVNLFWNASSGVAGYNVYRSTAANGTYSRINSTLDPNAAFTDGTVVSGQTYYYAATSVTSGGMESAPSTPAVQATVP
jgi:Abnormal spindle-like microcephaly-assoc'd, ASPM-SPD-2-Hydin